ncbi:phytoene desaturase family protein [Evansella tamaricis]|uniref:Phytoene desaturase n=1 Tax=Evansella tamaricis TaxID=2069301 RepID=A0ABS6JPK5_9BACI|nr:phytoene desaturase family protein [Evansella tamaricis]MBU9714742.1 phytoene desaturase [Evansella tamaricis]
MTKDKVVIIGSGPGGLAAAMLLSAKGFNVRVLEKQSYIGGRTSSFSSGEYTFDLGPTFFSMPYILEEIFEESDRKLANYMTLKKLDPMYTLSFDEFSLQATSDQRKMREHIENHFPGYGQKYDLFMKETRAKMNMLLPILQSKYDSLFDYLRRKSIKALPSLEFGKSLYDVLSRYFDDDRLKLSFTFQSKYLGMSPWECPGAFSILSFMEHEYGVYHPIGGVNQITKALAKVVEEHGGQIHKNNGVRKLVLNGNKVIGVELEDGEIIEADHVVMNADFAYGMTTLLDDTKRKKYKNAELIKKDYSCSTFMIYAGVKKTVNLDHHTIYFSKDYKKNVEQITKTFELSEDPSIYIQNGSVTDPTLAPVGKSALYILAPVPNNLSGVDWEREKSSFRDLIWDQLERRSGISLRSHLEEETILTPLDWERQKFVFQGATFNLSHRLGQMMYFRPHNRMKDIAGLWLVGGGTHPGSGLPTIFESARITTNLLVSSYSRMGER